MQTHAQEPIEDFPERFCPQLLPSLGIQTPHLQGYPLVGAGFAQTPMQM